MHILKKLKKILILIILAGLLVLIGVFVTYRLVTKAATDKIYNSIEETPYNKVGLLLGTGKFLTNGYVNLYYKYRIDAAAQLYKAGKISFVLVSGDNSRKDYDEPSTIKEDLILRGVPPDKIYLDYAGFRTFDSVVRCKEIFQQNSITVISQRFHNERALYIAQKKGINASAFNAKDVSTHYGFKTNVREYLARVKMVLDLSFGKEPKFLGEKIAIQ